MDKPELKRADTFISFRKEIDIMENDISSKLVDFAVKTQYEDLPLEVIEFAKSITLKPIGGTLAGSTNP